MEFLAWGIVMWGMYWKAGDYPYKQQGKSTGGWHKRDSRGLWFILALKHLSNHDCLKTRRLLVHVDTVLNWRFNPKPIKRNGGGLLHLLHIRLFMNYIYAFCFSFQYELPLSHNFSCLLQVPHLVCSRMWGFSFLGTFPPLARLCVPMALDWTMHHL